MTAKEKLLERVTKLSEAEASETLRLLEIREEGDSGDPWGDLGEWTAATGEDTMDMLEEEDTVGFSWGQRGAS